MLLIFVFFYWPSGEALYWAVTLEPPFGGDNEWVGLLNFQTVFEDPKYWNSVRISITFAFFATALSLGVAAVLALFVDRRLPGHQIYKFTFFLPYALAAPAVGLAFRFIFSPDAGFVSAINRLYPDLWNPALDGYDAFALIVMAQAWTMVGYNFIFFLAALQSIPRTVNEASAIDGAGVLRRMWDIQLPLIAPTLFFLIVINITDSFVNSFGIVDITTAGGPARATDLMVYKIYVDGFQGKDYSLAAAQSIVLMVLIVVLTFIQFRYIERRVHYS
ncbi:MAG TPA: ABC transporter permease subunit [Rhizobiales bacterium]|nr:ABC transporter permease subunit [Hyphomicrobiales bacterium]